MRIGDALAHLRGPLVRAHYRLLDGARLLDLIVRLSFPLRVRGLAALLLVFTPSGLRAASAAAGDPEQADERQSPTSTVAPSDAHRHWLVAATGGWLLPMVGVRVRYSWIPEVGLEAAAGLTLDGQTMTLRTAVGSVGVMARPMARHWAVNPTAHLELTWLLLQQVLFDPLPNFQGLLGVEWNSSVGLTLSLEAGGFVFARRNSMFGYGPFPVGRLSAGYVF